MAKIKLSRPHGEHRAGETIEVKPHEMAFYKGMGLIANSDKPKKEAEKKEPVNKHVKPVTEEKPQIRASK